METHTEESQGEKETNPASKAGGSIIQIDSISIDLSGEIKESPEECNHFTIRGFVAEARKRNGRRSSPFISDCGDNSSDILDHELPPIEVRKFKSSQCSNCVQEVNSSQETSNDNGMENTEKPTFRRSKRFSDLYVKTGWADLINGSRTSERSAKENQLVEGRSSHETAEETIRDPLCSRGNSQSPLPKKSAKGKRLPHDAFSHGASKENEMVGFSNSRGASSGKSVNEAVMVPFVILDCEKDTSSKKSDKDVYPRIGNYSQGICLMVPPGGSAGKAATPKSSKDPKQQKSASSQGMSKEFAMPPPGGFHSRKNSIKTSGKGYHLQHHGSSRGASDVNGYAFEKSTSSLKPSKQQSTLSLRPNIRVKNKGEASNSVSLIKKRSYAKRSVRQADSDGEKQDNHKDGFEGNSNQDSMPLVAGHMEADVVMPKRAAVQMNSNEEVGSINRRLEKNSSSLTSGKNQDSAGQSLLECYQSVKDQGKNNFNVVEEDHMGLRQRREPKFRLLSDVIAKKPPIVGKQADNPKASTGSPHDHLAGKVTSERVGDQSVKRKVSPVGSHDTSAGKGVSAKGGDHSTKTKPSPVGAHDTSAGQGISVSGIWRKRKRSTQDCEEQIPDSSKRISFRTAEPCPSVSPEAVNRTVADAKKQSSQILDKADAERKSKKGKFQQRPASENYCEKMDRFLEIAFGTGKAEKVLGNSKKKNISPLIEERQAASKFLQGGVGAVQNVSGDDTSDCIIIGNGPNKRKDARESSKFPATTALPPESEHYQVSISTEKESWKLQDEARATMAVCKAREGPSSVDKGKNAEAKGRVKDIDINSIPVDDKTPEQGSTDDIPMEIVELLAKHQHERRCEASRDKLSLVVPNGDSSSQKHAAMHKPQASYAPNGFSQRLEVMNPGKQKVSDNYEAGRTNVLVGYPKDGHFSGKFTGYTQSKGHVPSGAQYSSSVGSSLARTSSPTIIQQPPPTFGRYQGGPSSPLNTQIWPPAVQSRAPLGMLHKGSVPFKFDRVGAANQNSIPPQTWNSRISEYANSSSAPPQAWKWNSKISEYANGVRQNAPDFISPKGMRPVDLSSNETIPALQLLNLVQVASNRSSTPPVNRNPEPLKRLPFDHSGNQYKQYAPGPHFEPYKATASSSRHPSHDTEGRRNSYVEKPCQCPAGHMFAASAFQNEPNAGKSGGIKNRWTFASQDQRNMVAASYNAPVGNLCFDKSTTRVYSNDKKRHFSSSSSISIVPPMKKQVLDFGSHCNERALVPYQNKAEVCSTNRNPAELLDLREARSFLIGPEDLRRGKGIRFGPAPRRRKTILKGNGLPKPDNRLVMVGSVTKS